MHPPQTQKGLASHHKMRALLRMSPRIPVNFALATLLTAGGVWLLRQDLWLLPAKNDPGHALCFAGLSLRLLAGALFALATFALAVAYGRLTGRIPASGYGDPHAKGRILARYWYLIATALACLALAFALAERVAVDH